MNLQNKHEAIRSLIKYYNILIYCVHRKGTKCQARITNTNTSTYANDILHYSSTIFLENKHKLLTYPNSKYYEIEIGYTCFSDWLSNLVLSKNIHEVIFCRINPNIELQS